MSTILRKLRRIRDDLGLWTGVLYTVDRVCRRLGLPLEVRSYVIVAQPVPAQPMSLRRGSGEFEFRDIGPCDPALSDMPLEAPTLDFRFGQGARCFGLFRAQRVVAYLWLQTGAFDEDEVRCRFVPQPADLTSWDFDVYVQPEYRLSPAFLRLWDAANAWLRDRGVRYSLSRISAFNAASLRSHKRLGAQVVGRTDFLKLGRGQLLLSTLRPHLHLSLSRRSRPLIRVHVPNANAAESGSTVAVQGGAAAE